MLFVGMVELFFDYSPFENNSHAHAIVRYLMDMTLYPFYILLSTKNDYSHLYAINIQDFI